MYQGNSQNDAMELFTILMDCLDLEFKIANKESEILQLFYGNINNTVICGTCEKKSTTNEIFSNLSIELPIEENQLINSLSEYFRDETISGYDCSYCKQKRDSIKKLGISKLPEYLVIHLKRFV